MPVQLCALCFDALDPERLARFWSGLLGWEAVAEPDGRHLDVAPPADGDQDVLRATPR